MFPTVANAALYQAGWLACAFGAASGAPWAAPVATTGIVGWHLARASRPTRELIVLAIAALCGLVFETVLLRAELIGYPAAAWPAYWPDRFVPLWMVLLWVLFATTFNVSLRALRQRPLTGALLGAIGAPLAYWAGARIGALELLEPGVALVAIAAGWALITPALLRIARMFDGYAP